MYWNETIETMDTERLRALQDERLREQVRYTYDRVPFYKKMFDDAGAQPGDIRTAKDLEKLPFTSKTDLRDNYPYGLFAVPMDEVVRIHASSGTTGKATVVGYTASDLALWDECVARALTCAGGTREDSVQVCYGYGLFTGGLGLHGGAERIGATVIPASTGNTARQITMLQDYGSTMLCCTPSYALYIGETLEKNHIPLSTIHLKAGLFGAEPWTEEMRKKIEEKLGIKAYDIYGLSEVMGPGVSCECECQRGMHIWEDNFIIEVIDPDTGEVSPEGATGELVFTSLTKEAFPVIRYRTRDICSLNYEKCACGRTHVRMNKPQGRSDDMLIIRGVNVFPSQIEEVLLKVAGGEITPNYQIVVGRENNTDTFDVNVEMSEALFADDVKSIEKIEKTITEKLRSTLGIGARVHLVNPKSITRSEGKAKRVIDNRNLHDV